MSFNQDSAPIAGRTAGMQSSTIGAAAPNREKREWIPAFLAAPNVAWLMLFMVGALFVLVVMSFRGYEPGGAGILATWELTQYRKFLTDTFYLDILWRSIAMSLYVTLGCAIIGFPLAYWLSSLRGWRRAVLYIIVIAPLLTSAVIRTFGWMILLSNGGVVNKLLINFDIVDVPIPMMYRMTGIVIALVQVLLPFMVLALDAALLNIDRQLFDAARGLGAGAARIFIKITLPLSLPGIVSGSVLVFTLAISAFVTPALIGGPRVPVMATLIHQQGIALLDWPFGAAISIILLLVLLILLSVTLGVSARLSRRAA